MKTDRKTKAEKSPPKVKTVKGNGRVAPKPDRRQLLAAYEHIPVGIVEASLDGKYMDVNEEFCRIIGYSRKEALRRGIKDFTHEDDYGLDLRLYEQLIAGKIPFYRLEKRFTRKGGGGIWVELTRTLVCDAQGKPLYTMGVVLDISDRKDVERVLRDSVERLRLATGAAQMFMWEWDFQTQSYIIADNYEQVLGFSAGLLPKNKFESVWALSPRDDVQRIAESFEKAIEHQSDLHALPVRVINPENGQTVWLEISAKIVYDREGKPERMFGVAQNITESKNIQDEIKVISRMPEENPDPVMRLKPEGKVLYANPASAALLEDWMQGVQPELPEQLLKTLTQSFTSGMKTEVEFGYQGRHFSFSAAPFVDSGYVNLYGKDITKRKQAEEQLRESEERFRALVSQATAGIAESDLESRLVFVNPGFCEMLGYSETELLGKTIWELTYTQDLEENRRLFKRMLEKGEPYQFEKRFVRKDRSTLWTNVSVTAIHDLAGNPKGGVGVILDIDKRRGAEAALAEYARQQEALYRLADELHRTESLADVFDASLNAILDGLQCDRASILLYDDSHVMRFVAWRGLSDAYRKATEGHSPWTPDTKGPLPVIMDDVRTAELTESLRAVIQEEGIGSLAFIPLVSGERLIGKFMVYFDTPHVFEEEEIDLSLTIAHQLAFGLDRKRAEEQLRAKEAELETIIHKTPFMLTRCSRDLRYRFVSRAYAEMIGRTLEEMAGKPILEFMGEEGLKTVSPYIAQVLAGNQVEYEARVSFEGSGAPFLHVVYTPDRDEHGNVIGWFASIVDISERKRAEEKLRQSEERFRQAANASGALVYEVDLVSGVSAIVHGLENLTGYDPQEIDAFSEWWHSLIHPDDLSGHLAQLEELFKKGGTDVCDYRVRHKNGDWIFVQDNRLVIVDEAGKAVRLVGAAIDITERKQTEKRLALLAEISEMLRKVDDPYELMYGISEAVGEHLHVKRALFNEIDLEQDREIVHRDYHHELDSVAGIHKISDYSSTTSIEVASGKTVVNTDSKIDRRTAPDYEKTYAVSRERAYVVVPLMRDNRWVASLWVSDDAPRQWTSEEVSLLETVAERTWAVIEKLRLNAELRHNIAFDEAVMNSMGEGLYTVDNQGLVVFMNPAGEKLFGWTLEELRGRKMHDITHYQHRDGTPFPAEECAGLHVLRSGNALIGYQDVFIRKDGTFFDVTYSSSPLRGEDGSITGLVVVFEDNTEHKRYEQALRKSEERYRFIVENTSDGIWRIELTEPMPISLPEEEQIDWYYNHAVIRECNLGLARMYGYQSVEEVIGLPMRILMPRENLVNLELARRFIRSGYRIVDSESREIGEGAQELIFLNNMIGIVEDGKLKGEWGTNRDITERKRAEEALRRNEQMFSTLVDAAPFGVYFIDSEFRLRSINKGAEAVFRGIDPLIGRDFAEILRIIWQEPFATETIERFRHTLRTGESFISPPIVEPRANIDEIQAYDWQIHRITLSDGTFGVVCYFYDLSEQKRMEATVRASESLYRAIARSIPGGGVYVVDKDFRYLVAEGPVTEAFGLAREMLEGHTIIEAFPDERGKQMEDRLRRNFAGETVSFETAHHGRFYWTQQAPLLDSIGHAIIVTLDITERKRAEEALRQSEERFTLFMQYLPGLAWIKDTDGRYVYANAAAKKAFQMPPEDLYGKVDAEVFPPETAAQFKQNDQLALVEGRGVQVVETLQQEDGILHHSLVTKFPIPGPDGKAVLIGGTGFDITERLQAEQALLESEERFRAILRQATAGIVRKDAEGRLIFVNQAFCNMLGYTESELLGRTTWDFMHPDDVAENKESYDRLMLEGIPFKLERRFLRQDGSVIWVDASVSPIMDSTGKPQSAVAVEVDITGRKQAEEALRQLNLQLEDRVLSRTARLRAVNQTLREEITERRRVEEALRQSEALARANEEKLSTLFELLPVGISFLDLDGHVIQMNSALANILKLPKGQLVEQAYRARKYIRANGTTLPPAEFASRRAIDQGKTVYNLETGVVLEDNETIWTSVSAAPVNVADVGAVVVTVDITENKRAERALQESRERLQILSQRLVEVQEEERRAIARELHDRVGQTLAALNINLIIISGQLGGKVDEQINSRLNDSMKLVTETIALVRDVMSNLRPAVLDDYGLEAAIESYLPQFVSRYELKAKFAKPQPSIPRLGPSVEMTFLRIAQEALMNVVRHAQATQVNIALWQEDHAICMTVQDDGTGIASWQDANRPGSHGLTIMRERAEAFGGNLMISSVPGKGTKVEVKIPIETKDPTQAEKGKSE